MKRFTKPSLRSLLFWRKPGGAGRADATNGGRGRSASARPDVDAALYSRAPMTAATGRAGAAARSQANRPSTRSLAFATSPLLASKTPPWRSRFLVALVGAGFLGLLGRAAYVQLIASHFFQAHGDIRSVYTQQLPAPRGSIKDRNGQVLATSVALPTVQVDTKIFNASDEQRSFIARSLNMTRAELNERLRSSAGTVTLRRQVDVDVWQKIKDLKVDGKPIKGLPEVREYARRYPEGESAAHVVGFTDVEETGVAGIERMFDDRLLSTGGQRRVVRDREGRVVKELGTQAVAEPGGDIILSIDAKIQFEAWKRAKEAALLHNAVGASVVVLDVQSGELLAVANYPGFDPAKRSSLSPDQMLNRAVSEASEPGSTMKPFAIALALDKGLVTPHTVMDTSSPIAIPGSNPIKDDHRNASLTVQQVLQKSSNIGTAKLALKMERAELWETYAAVGFGQKPPLEFPALATGRLRAWKTWKPTDHARVSFGYSASASLVQMARAYSVFARDGEIIPITLLKREGVNGAPAAPVTGQRVFSARTAQQVREMLHMAASDGGTASQLQCQTLGYSVGGKTGTARKLVGKTYADGKYRAWYVGLAPIKDPRIVVAVMVDEPRKGQYYAGDVAAPVFSKVVMQSLRLLNVPADMDIPQQLKCKPQPAERESI